MSFFGTPSTPAAPSTALGSGAGLFTPQTPASTGSMFGGGSLFGSSPAFGGASSGGLFGSSTPAFGSSTPVFGSTPTQTPTAPAFGASTPAFGSSTPVFGSPAFGGSTPVFGSTTPSTPAFGLSSTPAFGSTSLFGMPSSSSLFGQTQSSSLFGQAQPSSSMFGTPAPQFGQTPGFGQPPQQPMFPGQLTTQMAPVAPLAVPLPEREIQAICDAYREDPANSCYAFKHLLLSVTEPSQRFKPPGVSDIMWAEVMSKLETMGTEDRERLYPELLLGFKDLSKRLQLQDEAISSDTNRLQATESNVKLLQRHFQVVTLPWLQRLRLKEQQLQRKLLKLTRIIEMLEAKGLRMPLTRSETLLGEKLRTLARQLQPTTELPRKVDSVLSISRLRAGVGNASFLPGQLDEQSLTDIQEVLRKQTEAISRLAGVLKRDMRDIEIITEDEGRLMGIDLSRAKARAAMDFASSNRYF
ncbi:nuclear pore complex protein NUP54-like [Selaginella moellendorffii]|uniref:nuclear pore complex protein NUP54-like n=1 Tax=Selaginella moellendorffii TaxID=88036 RepID=UPI000D1C52C6|nr:nuclear pore complex protein NUP54-like [Selaginella moellendorffii]|eukprot:XP_024538420.1 nuclear pore complex protein NUP54-like [Selaginella moellendorffii]